MTDKNRLIIGITGIKQSGKDTIANYLAKKYNFEKKSLAEPLKDSCKILFNLTDEQINGNKKDISDSNLYNLTPRRIMQFVGTDLLRNQMIDLEPKMAEDIFVNNFKNWYEKNTPNLVVIPDVRFQNEVNYIKSQNGYIIKIIYYETPNETSLLEKIYNFFKRDHESERQNVTFDYTVNNGYMYDFKNIYEQIDEIIEKINLN